MSRLSIENLPKPPKSYRPDLRSDALGVEIKFETKGSAAEEDERRLRSIKRLIKRAHNLDAALTEKRLKRLIRRIEGASSPASSRYMRKHRIRIAGHLWSMVAAHPELVSAFTIVPRTWEFGGGSLHLADPRLLLGQLRQALIRAKAGTAGGWLFASIHGEYEPCAGKFRVHVHGVAVGGMRAVVDRLRSQSNFRSERQDTQSGKVYRRLRMTRLPLSNLPEPLTYTVQSFWPERAAFENAAGKEKRQRNKHRIEQPQHTEVLLWLDRWRLRDTCLLMGVHVTRDGFRPTSKTYANGDGR